MCDYVFDGGMWVENKTKEDLTDVEMANIRRKENFEWECEFESYSGENKCIFHLSPEKRNELGITSEEVVEEFIGVIQDDSLENKFIGAKFGDFSISDKSIVPNKNRHISFEHANFHGDVNIKSCIVCDCTFSWADFQGRVSFKDSEFLDRCILFAVSVKDRAYFSADFDGYVNYDAAEFHSEVHSQGNYQGLVTFSESKFHEELTLHGSEFSTLYMRETKISSNINLSGIETEKMHLNPDVDKTESLVIDLSNSIVDEGSISLPENKEIYINFRYGYVGNVSINHEFNKIWFDNTSFDGFDFAAHRSKLEKVDWSIHEISPNEIIDVEFSPSAIETTYMKARNGSSQSGDNKSASKFFIKEMYYRRVKLLDEFDNKVDILFDKDSLFSYLANLTMEKTSMYGERPSRVLTVSSVVIALFAVIYPLTGSFKNDGEIYSLSLSNSAMENLLTLIDGFYFSLVTFTTVGYGDFQPAGVGARFLAGIESLLGALLMALLVFVLGRSVKW